MSLLAWFARSDALTWLLAAPAAWLLLAGLDRAAARRLAAQLGPRSVALAGARRRGRPALFALALLLAIAAMLRPVWGTATEGAPPPIDHVVCLDVSRSMLARDLAPDRLAAAKREIRALVERAAEDRFGLVLFAGEARLWVPLTDDRRSFAEMLELADPLAVGRGGTDLGAALDTALALLPPRGERPASILLVTDGEDLGGGGVRAAEACRERGVAVHAAGFGTALGSKIAVDGSGFLKSRDGEEVVSRMDAGSLRAIAGAAGGGFVDASDAESPLVRLYEERMLPGARERAWRGDGGGQGGEQNGGQGGRKDRFQWPLACALLLWVGEGCLGERRRR